jgi:cbb3-type cytochrome oxidase subunit 1
MARLDIKFLLLAAAALSIGVGMGIYMGIVHDFSLAPVHAHMNLVGWVSLALFGVTYKLYPELQERWPAKLHFALAAPAAILFRSASTCRSTSPSLCSPSRPR